MKTIILFTRRNTGLIALSHLVALGHNVMVVTDDDNVKWMAARLGCKLVSQEDLVNYKYDYVFSVHWHRKIPMWAMPDNNGVNFHPCLTIGLKGKDPISRYIQTGMAHATIDSHYMTSQIDEGEVIHTENILMCMPKSHAEFYNEAFPYYWKCIDETLNKLLNK